MQIRNMFRGRKLSSNLLFYGNCQVEAASQALQARNPDLRCNYAGNSNRVAKFDPPRSEKLMAEADLIIAQPIMNMERDDNHLAMRERFGDRVIFMPYIFIEGLHSLSLAGSTQRKLVPKYIIGGEIVLKSLRKHGVRRTISDYKTGRLDFDHVSRFAKTLAEMRRREEEASCEVRIADEIEAMHHAERVMLTHNHPNPNLINIIAGKISEHLGRAYDPLRPNEVQFYLQITLPVFETIVTPWCQRDLGLDYPYDLQWFRSGRDLIRKLADVTQIDPDS